MYFCIDCDQILHICLVYVQVQFHQIWPIKTKNFVRYGIFSRKREEKKLHFAIIDLKLCPIFNTFWHARDLKFCMSQVFSVEILLWKFGHFWCASSLKKRVLYSSQVWFKICNILKSCFGKTTISRILRFYTEIHHESRHLPTTFQIFMRRSEAPMAKSPIFWIFGPLHKIQDAI